MQRESRLLTGMDGHRMDICGRWMILSIIMDNSMPIWVHQHHKLVWQRCGHTNAPELVNSDFASQDHPFAAGIATFLDAFGDCSDACNMNGEYPNQALPKDVQLAHIVNRYGQTIILDAIVIEQWNNINTTTETVYVDVAYSLNITTYDILYLTGANTTDEHKC